jgi:hypothetical protein
MGLESSEDLIQPNILVDVLYNGRQSVMGKEDGCKEGKGEDKGQSKPEARLSDFF